MKLVETTVTESAVRMRYADNADPAKATAWVDFRAPLAELKLPSATPVGDPAIRRFGLVQIAALRYVQDAIDAEIARLEALGERSYR